MAAERKATSEERLIEAVERLTTNQRSVHELQLEANRIRQYIRDYDVDMEALNLLVTVRMRAGKDGGTRVLEDLFRYARLTGTQLDAPERPPAAGGRAEAAPPVAEKKAERAEERESGSSWKFFAQLAAALALTTGLFVLIH